MINREQIYLAALLHDIGKFYQRADENPFWDSNALSAHSVGLADYICPKNEKGNLGYHHVIWTNEFFELTKAKWKELGMYSDISNEDSQEMLFRLAIYHHRPANLLQAIIQTADWWSSGIDREHDYKNFASNNDYSDFRNVGLMSIWETIRTEFRSGSEKGTFGYDLNPLSLDGTKRTIFPVSIDKCETGSDSYGKLWDQFIEEFNQLPVTQGEFASFAESLLFLLRKYLWCIPASTRKTDLPTSNLFEHLKTTAAIADCLAAYYSENETAFEFDGRLKINNDSFPLLLFCGDISGIQNFIYNVSSRQAGVSLKGRSFYIQLLCETIVQRVIDSCRVNTGHIVYASGGKFYMLLPNTSEVKREIRNLELDVLKGLKEEGHPELYVAMDYVPFAYRFGRGNEGQNGLYTEGRSSSIELGELWAVLLNKLASKKQRKYADLLLNEEFFNYLFMPQGVGGKAEVCTVTGLEISKLDGKQKLEDNSIVSGAVFEQIEIGKALKDADFLVTYKEPMDKRPKRNVKSIEPLGLRIHHYLFNKEQLSKDESDFRYISSVDVARVKRINSLDFLNILGIKGRDCSYGYHLYGGNKQAEIYNRYKTFEELAQSDSGSYNKLGILRMDVDGLGGIFSTGLGNKTLAGFATLSGYLDLFFSGYINEIRSRPAFIDWINVIYSGGDDVFAVGRWDKIIQFAREVRDEFRKFVCDREDISISAGIAVVSASYPIAKSADLAGHSEDLAKKFGENAELNIPAKKNALCLFEETFDWNDEFHFVEQLKTNLVNFCCEGKISSGFIQKLIDFHLMKKKGESKQYTWTSAYYFARVLKPLRKADKKDLGLISFIEDIQKGCLNPRNLDLYGVAARWAELELRSIK